MGLLTGYTKSRLQKDDEDTGIKGYAKRRLEDKNKKSVVKETPKQENLAMVNRVTDKDLEKIKELDSKKKSSLLSLFTPRNPISTAKTLLNNTVLSKTPEEAKRDLQTVAKSKTGAAALGLSDAATLGLNRRIVDNAMPNNSPYATAQQSQSRYYTGGQIAGYVLPGAATTKFMAPLAEQLASKVSSTVLKKMIEGGLGGATMEAAEGLIRGEKPKEVGKRVATGAALGAVGDVAIYGLGKGIGKLASILRKPVSELADAADNVVLEKVSQVNLKQTTGSYSFKNKEYEKAVSEYNDAIEQIQNHYGTNELRVDEVKAIKKDLGIDLDSIISRMEKSEGKKIASSNELKLKRAAGVADKKVYDLTEKVAKQNPEVLQKQLDNYTQRKTNIESRIKELETQKPYNYEGNVKSLKDNLGKVNKKINDINLQTFGGESETAATSNAIGNINSAKAKFNYKPAKTKTNIGETITKLRTQLVDKYAPLENLEKNIKGKVGGAENSLYKQARLYEGVPERANVIIEKELKPIIRNVEKKGYTYKDLGLYAEAMHAKDVNKAGIKSGLTDGEINDIINKLGTPEMEEARKQLIDYNNRRLKDLAKSGVISREAYLNMRTKWENYMPLFRAIEDDKVEFGKSMGNSFSNVATPIKGLKGSELDIIDPIESIIKNTYKIENAIGRNKVGQQLSNLANESQTLIRKLNPGEEVGRKNVVAIKENGENVSYEVSPEAYKAMKDMNKESSNVLIKLMSKPAGVLRAGATLTPDFALRNPVRDVMNAFIVSKSGFNPFTDFAVGLGSYIKKGKYYEEFLRNNGGYGNMLSMDRQAHREALQKIIKQPIGKKFINIVNPKSWLSLMRTISDATESATKIGEFRAAVKKAKASPQEAAYRARDLMDFARVGSSVKEANKVVAFLNANIQGKSKFIRAIKENPIKVTMKLGVAMAVPSLAVYKLNSTLASDEQKATIKDAPAWLKNSFWLVAVPGTDKVARIPKPFEGAAVSNTIERFLDYVLDNDKEAFDGFLKETIQQQSIPVMMNAITPFMEGAANYSYFRQAPIIPEREKNLLPKDQYDIYTSEVSKKIAEVIQKTPLKDSNFASPRIVENTIKGATGGVGTYALEGTDMLLGKNKPAKNIDQFPAVKAFTVNDKSTGKAVEVIYNEKDKLTKERGSAKLGDKTAEYEKESQYKYINKAADEISDISKEIRSIQNDQKLTAKQKRDKINVLADKRNKVARDAMQQYKTGKW